MSMDTVHVPVLLQEIVDNGNLTPGSVVLSLELKKGAMNRRHYLLTIHIVP